VFSVYGFPSTDRCGIPVNVDTVLCNRPVAVTCITRLSLSRSWLNVQLLRNIICAVLVTIKAVLPLFLSSRHRVVRCSTGGCLPKRDKWSKQCVKVSSSGNKYPGVSLYTKQKSDSSVV